MSEIVKLYNPANAASLTPEQIAGLQSLTSAQIKELATAYPNMVMQRAYLLIIDGSKPAERQLPSLSTFENLWNLRERNGMRKYVAYSFKGSFKPKTAMPARSKRTEVVDLSDTELLSLPGFKTANTVTAPVQVPVTKVNKVPKAEKTKSK